MKKLSMILSLLFLVNVNPGISQSTFVNPISEGADPWVIKTDSCYFFCSNIWISSIVVWKSDKLTDRGIRRVVWDPPTVGWNRTDIWAPELHYLQGKWYIFYSAGDGEYDYINGVQVWKNQRSGVLECLTQDPTTAAWIDRGMLYTSDNIETWDSSVENNTWAIDPTPLEMNGKLYCIWSGWDSTANVANSGFTQQNLYIAEMENPYTIKTNRVKISSPTYPWEIGNVQKVNEGPQVLKHGYNVYVIYSGPDYWTLEYKMGQLSIPKNSDPMNLDNWTKKSTPVFQGTDNVLSVGHGSMTTSPDGSENWLLYRSKQKPVGGWERDIRLQKFAWNPDGSPNFGIPSPAGTVLDVPSGEKENESGISFSDDFHSDYWDDWNFYGWESNIAIQNHELHLGCGGHSLFGGDKAIIRGWDWKDFVMEADVKIISGTRDAGLIFRISEPAFGWNAHKGYFAGLEEQNNKVYLSRMDGSNFVLLQETTADVQANTGYRLKIQAEGSQIQISVDGDLKIQFSDSNYLQGMVGVRVVETHSAFDDFQIDAQNTGIKHHENIPEKFNLLQNYPNPFNNSTQIRYKLHTENKVTLHVYNMKGETVAQLVDEVQLAGMQKIPFAADDLSSGVYFYQLKINEKVFNRKMVLIR